MIVLGIHGGVTLGQHEPGAALCVNGTIEVACEEERYLRIKSCYGMLPAKSIRACLDHAEIQIEDVDLIVAPGVTYDDFEQRLKFHIKKEFGHTPPIKLVNHQFAHLATAFYGSTFDESLVVSIDASGDGLCSMVGLASRKSGIEILSEMPTSNSLGYFYTLMTHFLGFNDGDEYKVMGLAPYGDDSYDLSSILSPRDKKEWEFDWSYVRDNPSPRSPFETLFNPKIEQLLGLPPREDNSLNEAYRDLARSTQEVTEMALLGYMKKIGSLRPDVTNLCYAGGVALNCKANMRIKRECNFKNFYVSPAASDRGLPIGCAYLGATELGDVANPLKTVYLGGSYGSQAVEEELKSNSIKYTELDDPSRKAAELIGESKIIGWYQGRSEIGARALGNRSILASCTEKDMKNRVNAKIKYREDFRPFAPATLLENAHQYFHTDGEDYPYMCFTVEAKQKYAETLCAVVHEDCTSRLQTVRREDNPSYYDLIKSHESNGNLPVILNTSFNLKGQPIVETPRDAIMTFFGCGLDALIVDNFLIEK